MRYFIVKYVTRMVRKGFKMEPQMDEIISVSKKLKMNDYQTSAVILDFKTGRVVQASMNGVTLPKDFLKIRDYYQKHYDRVIQDLESVYGRFELGEPIIPGLDDLGETAKTPDTEPGSN